MLKFLVEGSVLSFSSSAEVFVMIVLSLPWSMSALSFCLCSFITKVCSTTEGSLKLEKLMVEETSLDGSSFTSQSLFPSGREALALARASAWSFAS